ncbi:AAA family ATPase [Candidatus Kuenenbacteria bacterium]|nr:AAA family ATPase [Candidatus Kuenenbacteria bacterium]
MIIGHEKIIYFLQKSVDNDKLSHAYLFCGPEHLGKTIIAENFLFKILCEQKNKPDAFLEKNTMGKCGKCIHCQQLEKNIHPDVYFINKEENKKNITIEQIRILQEKLIKHSFYGSYKIILINQADALSLEAANYLLKSLGEPNPKTIFILIAENIKSLPKTIISRMQILKFLPVATEEIVDYFEKQFNLKTEQALELAKISINKPGLAITFFQNKNLLDKHKKQIQEFIDFPQKNLNEKFQLIEKILPTKNGFLKNVKILQNILSQLDLIIRDLILIKNSLNTFIIHSFLENKLEKLVQKYSENQLIQILKAIKKSKEYLLVNANPKLVFENLILKI